MANEGDLKVLAQFDNEIEASIVKGMLEANGINAGVLGDNTASTLLRGLDKGLWRVVVKPEDFDAADALLNTPIEEVDDDDDDEQ
ncbi:MAG: DUF2007 domain-containing protein [Bacteroidales bacterium]|nr:DUF2007 domain-containing protein [Bacteroidales bacterium]